MIPFAEINRAALAVFPQLLEERFPAGQRRGREFVLGDLRGKLGKSLKINLVTGKWADSATGARGGDPISLFAAADHGGNLGDAARALGIKLGVSLGGASHAPSVLENPDLSPVLKAARLLGIATASGDHGPLCTCLAHLSIKEVIAFTQAVREERADFMAQVWIGEAWVPGGEMWQAAAGFRDRLDAEARRWRETHPPDPRRQRLAGVARAAARDRLSPRDMLVALYRCNAALNPPLPVAAVDRIAIWAAEQVREAAHA